MSVHDSTLTIRLTVLGKTGSGKSALVTSYVGKAKWDTSECENASYVKDIMIDGKIITLHILDSDGKNSATWSWSHGIIILYAVDDRSSFTQAEDLILQTRKLTMRNADIVLVANKADVSKREVSMEEGQKLASKHNCSYFETSGSHDQSEVKRIFKELSTSIISQRGLVQRKTPKLIRRIFSTLAEQGEKYGERLRRASFL